jgi:SNF2 family DNA or RNA helicase
VQIKEPLARGRAKTAMTRLHVILKAILLRRTKFQQLDGKPILKLTKRNVHIVKLEFSDPCAFASPGVVRPLS